MRFLVLISCVLQKKSLSLRCQMMRSLIARGQEWPVTNSDAPQASLFFSRCSLAKLARVRSLRSRPSRWCRMFSAPSGLRPCRPTECRDVTAVPPHRACRAARLSKLACKARSFGIRAVRRRFACPTALSAFLLAPNMLALARWYSHVRRGRSAFVR